jgi:hypothetical protein
MEGGLINIVLMLARVKKRRQAKEDYRKSRKAVLSNRLEAPGMYPQPAARYPSDWGARGIAVIGNPKAAT